MDDIIWGRYGKLSVERFTCQNILKNAAYWCMKLVSGLGFGLNGIAFFLESTEAVERHRQGTV